ncbi:e3 ubiquitin-protein ligase RGLG2 [Trichonephila clavipes]|nr:e3 ubiquitin-protein ligase RGLG2 [Trichonephila clavipes]
MAFNGSESSTTEDLPCRGGRCTLNLSRLKRLLVGVVSKLGEEMLAQVQRSGPTTLAPIIRRATDIVRRTGMFHILLIVTDGQMRPDETHTRHALVEASKSALSIVVVGVGDGPWRALEEWDERVPDRVFDNFHFVNYHHVVRSARNAEAALALHALMEIPDQYQTILRLNYLSKY